MARMNATKLAAAAVILAWIAGCVERTTYDTSDGSEKVAKLLLEKVPAKMDRKLNANFDDKVTLLGYDVDRKEAAPGDKVRVTWYWECREAPGPGWRLFTHMVDGSGTSRINKDGAGPVRKNFQPEHWKKGTIVKDPQRITIPKSWSSSTVGLRVGLWKGGDRMRIKKGPRDNEMRIKGPAIKISSGEPREKHTIPRAAKAPVIDGSWKGEDAWEGAVDLGEFTNTLDGGPVPFDTDARIMWDDENIYVCMTTEDDYLQSKYTEHDDELWHEDAFEVFLDPGADKKHYYEIQVSPAGVVFDSYLPRYRKNTNDWSSGVQVGVKVDGTLNDGEGGDTAWSAEMRIPLAALDKGGAAATGEKDTWAVNFFRVDATDTRPRYSAWSPPMRGDFHALDRFGLVVFEQPPVAQAPTGGARDAGAAGGSR